MTLRRPLCCRDLGLAFGLVLIGLAACRSQGVAEEHLVISAVQHGRYSEAMEVAQRLIDENPGDERIQVLFQQARVAHILDQGRKEVFRGDLDEALDLFHQARALAPGHPTVESWIGKTRAQLAVRWLDRAAEVTGPERLVEAENAYEKVLEYAPDNLEARAGLAQALLLANYRAGQSKTYFDDGLSSFRALLLEQARRSFMVSRRYRDNEAATTRGVQVEKLLAEERLQQATSLEGAGLFFAARNEYRFVLLIDPANVAGRAGLDRMDRESRATNTLAKADMEIRRGEVEDARKTLDGAELLTTAQLDHVSLLATSIDDKSLEDIYIEARGLTEDYRYPEAVEVFDALLAVAPDYKDAAARKATLKEFIHMAEEFYAKALEASDDASAELNLKAVHVVWPEYRDVAERLAAIEARKIPAAAGSDADAVPR